MGHRTSTSAIAGWLSLNYLRWTVDAGRKGAAGSALVSVQVLTKQYQKLRTVTAAAVRPEDHKEHRRQKTGLELDLSNGGGGCY